MTCPPRTRLDGERLYTLLRPTACQGGEGHAVARGDCRRHAGSQDPAASSRKPEVCTTPLPTPVQGWVASAYILSCAPLLVRGERATQWRGGIADSRQPIAGSRKPAAESRHYSLAPHCLSGGRGPRSGEGGIAEGTPAAGSRKPKVCTTPLRPTACQGGEGHAVARGDCRRHAGSRKPEAESLHYALAPHCLSGGRGPRSGEGGLPKARREPAAGSR